MGESRSIRGRVAVALGAGACLLATLAGGLASGAGAETAAAPAAGVATQQAGVVRDRIIGPLSTRERRATTSQAQNYPDGDGHTVSIEVDPLAYPFEDHDQIAQDFAQFIGTRLHDDEIGSLNAYITDAAGMAAWCGPGALACYSPSDETMFTEKTSGEQPSSGDPSPNFVITHELGHHISNNRDNAPWDGLDQGPKRWGSYERICPGVRSGEYHPGDQGLNYENNPGEGWAEAFAFRHYPNQIPWDLYNPDFEPDQRAFDEIWRDVKKPWTGRVTSTWHNRFRAGDPNVKRRQFTTPLDGSARITLTMPSTTDFDLRILASNSGKILATGLVINGTREVAFYTVCGRRSFRAEVLRESGRGAFRVQVLRP